MTSNTIRLPTLIFGAIRDSARGSRGTHHYGAGLNGEALRRTEEKVCFIFLAFIKQRLQGIIAFTSFICNLIIEMITYLGFYICNPPYHCHTC